MILPLSNQNTIIINIKKYYFIRYKKSTMKLNKQKTKMFSLKA